MLGKRLQQIMDYYQLNPISFSEKLQIQRSSLSHFFTGRNKPGWDFLEKMTRAFPEINLQWFITGSGNMLNSINLNTSKIEKQIIDENKNEFFIEFKKKESNNSKDEQHKEPLIDKIIIFYKHGTCKIYLPE